MTIINIIDNIDKVNFGVWNAAISTATILRKQYNIASELWYPTTNRVPSLPESVKQVPLSSLDSRNISELLRLHQLTPTDTIIHIHGCWQYPTRWGKVFGRLGFQWIYCPQGMLEPWQLAQKRLKKAIYLRLIERKIAEKATVIRAVSSPEKLNLERLFPTYKYIQLIPNGVAKAAKSEVHQKEESPITVLFLGRLHHKKNVLELVQAWIKSKLFKHPNYRLIIAGPDQTELKKINSLLKKIEKTVCNISYVGAVYDQKKINLLHKSSYFVLPSQSEGFPSSVLEAMSYGLIPVISDGCNFPELFQAGLGIRISHQVEDIIRGLNKLLTIDNKHKEIQQAKGINFINQHYSLQAIAAQQAALYHSLLEK